jgi:hypothetical protein
VLWGRYLSVFPSPSLSSLPLSLFQSRGGLRSRITVMVMSASWPPWSCLSHSRGHVRVTVAVTSASPRLTSESWPRSPPSHGHGHAPIRPGAAGGRPGRHRMRGGLRPGTKLRAQVTTPLPLPPPPTCGSAGSESPSAATRISPIRECEARGPSRRSPRRRGPAGGWSAGPGASDSDLSFASMQAAARPEVRPSPSRSSGRSHPRSLSRRTSESGPAGGSSTGNRRPPDSAIRRYPSRHWAVSESPFGDIRVALRRHPSRHSAASESPFGGIRVSIWRFPSRHSASAAAKSAWGQARGKGGGRGREVAGGGPGWVERGGGESAGGEGRAGWGRAGPGKLNQPVSISRACGCWVRAGRAQFSRAGPNPSESPGPGRPAMVRCGREGACITSAQGRRPRRWPSSPPPPPSRRCAAAATLRAAASTRMRGRLDARP